MRPFIQPSIVDVIIISVKHCALRDKSGFGEQRPFLFDFLVANLELQLQFGGELLWLALLLY
jgi:hypothetical protein